MRRLGVNLKSKEVLIASFDKSIQRSDLTVPPNCNGFGRIRHFKRLKGPKWPDNPLPIDPALNWLRKPFVDEVKVQLFQIAVCNWNCWYCYVDTDLRDGSREHSSMMRTSDLIDLYVKESIPTDVIVLSGGQPDLVPEWVLWFADELNKRNLNASTYLWSDDNLSNDYIWEYLSKSEITRLSSYPNYGRVGCIKGFDDGSFFYNTSADPKEFSNQLRRLKRLIDSGFDVYGYVTLTSDNDNDIASKIHTFIDRIQEEVHWLFPLRVIPLRIEEWTPTPKLISNKKALQVQLEAVDAWQKEIAHRFPSKELDRRIFEHTLHD